MSGQATSQGDQANQEISLIVRVFDWHRLHSRALNRSSSRRAGILKGSVRRQDNLRYLRTGKIRSTLVRKFGHEPESAVVGIDADGAPRILSSLQVIVDGMISQGERLRQLNEGAQESA
jgi:hypothetical protein